MSDQKIEEIVQLLESKVKVTKSAKKRAKKASKNCTITKETEAYEAEPNAIVCEPESTITKETETDEPNALVGEPESTLTKENETDEAEPNALVGEPESYANDVNILDKSSHKRFNKTKRCCKKSRKVHTTAAIVTAVTESNSEGTSSDESPTSHNLETSVAEPSTLNESWTPESWEELASDDDESTIENQIVSETEITSEGAIGRENTTSDESNEPVKTESEKERDVSEEEMDATEKELEEKRLIFLTRKTVLMEREKFLKEGERVLIENGLEEKRLLIQLRVEKAKLEQKCEELKHTRQKLQNCKKEADKKLMKESCESARTTELVERMEKRRRKMEERRKLQQERGEEERFLKEQREQEKVREQEEEEMSPIASSSPRRRRLHKELKVRGEQKQQELNLEEQQDKSSSEPSHCTTVLTSNDAIEDIAGESNAEVLGAAACPGNGLDHKHDDEEEQQQDEECWQERRSKRKSRRQERVVIVDLYGERVREGGDTVEVVQGEGMNETEVKTENIETLPNTNILEVEESNHSNTDDTTSTEEDDVTVSSISNESFISKHTEIEEKIKHKCLVLRQHRILSDRNIAYMRQETSKKENLVKDFATKLETANEQISSLQKSMEALKAKQMEITSSLKTENDSIITMQTNTMKCRRNALEEEEALEGEIKKLESQLLQESEKKPDEAQKESEQTTTTTSPLLSFLQDLIQTKSQELECPVCLEEVTPGSPIYCCEDHHLVCATCRPRLRECPSCRGPYRAWGQPRRLRGAEKGALELQGLRQRRDDELARVGLDSGHVCVLALNKSK